MQQAGSAKPDQRLATKYRFDDEDMDLFFVAALGWGPAGGLDVGQTFHIASQITDGDAESWVRAFAGQGELLDDQADDWLARGARRNAGEARLKAFAAYRSSWQFASPYAPDFAANYARHQRAFAKAMDELQLPATFFQIPGERASLPGVFLQNADRSAPVVLVIGGADTCFEDLFLTAGRNLLERGYSVAIADLPGQGNTAAQGLHWPVEAEKPIAAVTDLLVERFGAPPGRRRASRCQTAHGRHSAQPGDDVLEGRRAQCRRTAGAHVRNEGRPRASDRAIPFDPGQRRFASVRSAGACLARWHPIADQALRSAGCRQRCGRPCPGGQPPAPRAGMHGVDGRSVYRESLIMAMLLAFAPLSVLHQFRSPQTQWLNLWTRGSVDRR
jgi:hypothetical protein